MQAASHPTSVYDWQLRVQCEFKPLDAIPSDVEEVVLPEAEGVSDRRRARVRLPSGKIMRVIGSVLVEYCKALKPHSSELLNGVVWLTYTPTSKWGDWVVERFFSDLHKDRTENGYIDRTDMSPEYGPLIHALDVPAARPRFVSIDSYQLENGIHDPSSYFCWLGAYQLFSSSWAADALRGLRKHPADKFKLFVDAANRHLLLETFSTAEILQLAYSRWRGNWYALPTPQAVRAERLGTVILDRVKELPPAMQLKLVISEQFAVVCNYDVIEATSLFIRNAPVDESGSIATMHLPFAVSFPQSEVLDFFEMLHSGRPLAPNSTWKLSWVQFADHLQMPSVLDAAAPWVWNTVHFHRFIAWLSVTRLQSMQQRRPADKANTVEAADVMSILTARDVYGGHLHQIVDTHGERFVELLGMDGFLDLLHAKPN